MLILSFSKASNVVDPGHNDSLNLKFQQNNDFNRGISMFIVHLQVSVFTCSEEQNQKRRNQKLGKHKTKGTYEEFSFSMTINDFLPVCYICLSACLSICLSVCINYNYIILNLFILHYIITSYIYFTTYLQFISR